MAYFTYMVLCRDDSLYTGYTDNLVKRIKAHNSGKGAKYTRMKGPVKLVYWQKFATKQEAMSREAYIKQWTREQKLKLLPESDQQRLRRQHPVEPDTE